MINMGTNRRKRRSRLARVFFTFIISWIFFVAFVFIKSYFDNSFLRVQIPIRSLKKVSSSKNYFMETKHLKNVGLIIETTNCQIPDFSQWDPLVSSQIKQPKVQNDSRKNKDWSYMIGNELFISKGNMQRDRYTPSKIACCYKIIQRTEQPKNKYNKTADSTVSHSNCISISQPKTPISKEFIMVECSNSSLDHHPLANIRESKAEVLYRGFHTIPQPHNLLKTHDKIRYWNNKVRKSQERPPNILIIGLDSTSGFNFRKQMLKTRKLLEKMGAVEMLGYVKAGEHTFPNYCPMLFGYSEKDLKQICYLEKYTKFDDCPSIYKRLDEAKYLTAHTEDSPVHTAFNYKKTGFVERPVDFYLRPLFLSARIHNHSTCVGAQTNDEAIYSYVHSVLEVAAKNETPIFSLSWSTRVQEDNPNSNQLSDSTYAKLLEKLEKNGHLNNTILFFLGDHGHRLENVRKTLIGYYRDKLPSLWIVLPPSIKAKFPMWAEALKVNSRRLTSPFTLYWTLNFILDTFTNTSRPISSTDFNTKEIIRRGHRQHFFEQVPESNTCSDVGVTEDYCPCFPNNEMNLLDSAELIDTRSATILKIK